MINHIIFNDLNNNKKTLLSFNEMTGIYDNDMFVIDAEELGNQIAQELIHKKEIYEWSDVEQDDINIEINSWIYDLLDKLNEKIESVLEEENIKIWRL